MHYITPSVLLRRSPSEVRRAPRLDFIWFTEAQEAERVTRYRPTPQSILGIFKRPAAYRSVKTATRMLDNLKHIESMVGADDSTAAQEKTESASANEARTSAYLKKAGLKAKLSPEGNDGQETQLEKLHSRERAGEACLVLYPQAACQLKEEHQPYRDIHRSHRQSRVDEEANTRVIP
jgi:hypothetical protein